MSKGRKKGAEERERAKAEDARLLARGLVPVSEEDLDAISSAERRELYKRLGLTVMAHADGSLTITWFVDIDLGELRCQEEGTSRRSSSSANLPPNKIFGFDLILREDTPSEASFRVLGGASEYQDGLKRPEP